MDRLRFASLVAAIALSAALSGCSAESETKADGDAAGAESVDALDEARACTVSETVSAEIDAPIEDVYDYVAREDTPARDLHRFLLVPGVRGDRLITPGGWDHPGARRFVFLDDGASCVEELDVLDRPRRFAYHSDDYSFPLGLMIAEARGTWTFETSGAGTSVSWTYTFTPRSCLKQGELRVFARTMFQPYMQRAMTSIANHIEGR